MGDTGPCGPCTEIHVDCRDDAERKKQNGKELVNADHPQVIEIWNNVFIQFNRLKDGSLAQLPAKHVDTGMGFERLVRVLQNKQSNYDTDVFTETLAEIEKISGRKYDQGESKQAIAFRVIADHIRAIAFTISDGQLPSNTGAGYVIRRILRRAVRYYYSYLDHKQPLLHLLVPVLAKQFQDVFPELKNQQEFVARVVKEEEDSFLRTLEKGILNFNERIKTSEAAGGPSKIFDGSSAFLLYDTYGFPVDLTQLMAKEIGWTVDMKKFEAELTKQKDRSRSATAMDTGDWVLLKEGNSKFVGYDLLETRSEILKYRKVKAKGKEFYQIVLDQTAFYAESGGQVGDTGELIIDGSVIKISDTKKENDLIVHFADELPTEIKGVADARVDAIRRKKIALHHSATHLLHAALRKILGTHVAQKGSLVADDYMRFDFSHFAKMADEEILKVEALVNEKIRENIPVVIKQMPKEEAMKTGAMALFGEKYGDTVRVVIIDPTYSIELCGGTHVGSTGELGLFRITSETAIAAGVRRIEAVAGQQAEFYVNAHAATLENIKQVLKNPKDVLKSVENLVAENASLAKKIENLEARQLVAIRNDLLHKDEIINGVTFVGDIIEVSNPDALKKLCFELKNKLTDHIAVLCANIDGKPYVAIGISERVVVAKNLDAGKIIKDLVAPLIKGGGGGQKSLATAGGTDPGRLGEVIVAVKELL
jgi:alanyl-tRNA synthetase